MRRKSHRSTAARNCPARDRPVLESEREGEPLKTTERKNLSGTPHQRELKVRNQLTESMFQDMLMMLEELTPDERRKLKDPDFVTEDEADIIICDRRADEETFPAEDVLRELGIPIRKRA